VAAKTYESKRSNIPRTEVLDSEPSPSGEIIELKPTMNTPVKRTARDT
jgi:hypothetical protein